SIEITTCSDCHGREEIEIVVPAREAMGRWKVEKSEREIGGEHETQGKGMGGVRRVIESDGAYTEDGPPGSKVAVAVHRIGRSKLVKEGWVGLTCRNPTLLRGYGPKAVVKVAGFDWIVCLFRGKRCNDLTKVNHGVQNVQLMTFGQPRIGNAAFATYFNEHVADAVRVTHENDIVPHLPPYYSYFSQKTYHHFPREVYSV
ncbi:hypothetical protein BHM03_00038679, partial [Ensete ventricosum]